MQTDSNQLRATLSSPQDQARQYVRWLRAVAVNGDAATVKRVCLERHIPLADHDLDGLRGELLKLAASQARDAQI